MSAAYGPFQGPAQELPPARDRYEAAPLHRHASAKDLFATYQKERAEALQVRNQQTRELRDRQQAYRRELAQWYRDEREKLRHGWLESLSPDKSARYRDLAGQRQKLFERSKAEEMAGLAKIRITQESRAAAILALSLATSRFGDRPLVVEGLDAFRAWVAEESRRPGLRVRFADPSLGPQANRAPRPGARPMPGDRPKPAEGPASPASTPPSYQPWSAGLKGEFTYQGLRDGPGGPALVWRQGEILFAQPAKCADCHGANGEGLKDGRGEFVFPALWGDQFFNIGAGMARTDTAAAFVKNNMPVAWGINAPLGQGGLLSDQEALDVAEYSTHQPRPDFAPKVKD